LASFALAVGFIWHHLLWQLAAIGIICFGIWHWHWASLGIICQRSKWHHLQSKLASFASLAMPFASLA
jgi:hypothetical protein